MRIGMRWWLALAFAAVAATTAIAVAELSSARSAAEFRERAQSLAAGKAFEAAIDLRDEPVGRVAEQRRLALFVFDRTGKPVSSTRSFGVPLAHVSGYRDAVVSALDGRRFIATDEDVGATTLGLPFGRRGGGALVVYASHPDLAAELGIVHDEIDRAAWAALILGGLVGAIIATLIARRLRRIARAAAAMEAGDLQTPVARDFPDEVGDLAETFDRMRKRLRLSFLQLEADRDRMAQLLERLQEAVIAVDRDLRVQFANTAAKALLGPLTPGDPLPDPWETASLRDFARLLFRTDALSGKRLEPDEERVYSLEGVPAGDNDVAVLVLRDLTAGERRERAEREFVANAAHELRTPLTTILGAVQVLQDGAKSDPADRDRFIAHIEREARRLVRLTRALLVLARAQTREEQPRLTAVRLRPLLEDVAESTHTHPGVSVRVECDEQLYVEAESELLEQALVNVAENAGEHTCEGHVLIAASANGTGRVRIEVSDTGPGVPAAIRDRVFDRFYRPDSSNGDGFGLGLAIARQAVKAQSGSVALGETDRGTCVAIELRRAEP